MHEAQHNVRRTLRLALQLNTLIIFVAILQVKAADLRRGQQKRSTRAAKSEGTAANMWQVPGCWV